MQIGYGDGGGDLEMFASEIGHSLAEVSGENSRSEQHLEIDKLQFNLGDLPDSLLVEILVRLPVKSVFRFKCVSKHWCSLIRDRWFARIYVSRKLSSSDLSPFRILYRYIYVSVFEQVLERLNPDAYKSKNSSVLFLSSFEEQQQADQFKVLAASNGLLLCCLLGPLMYYVCDPVTKQWVALPKPRSVIMSRHPIFFGEGLVTLLNEENVVTSYRVVRVEWLSVLSDHLNFETYSSETGEWKELRLSCPSPVRLLKRGSPFLFNGAMHWYTDENGLVAFDPYKNVKECRLIKLPGEVSLESKCKEDGIYRLCGECQGQLRYFEVAPDRKESFCFSMWVITDYDRQEWELKHRVKRSEIWSDDPHISSYLGRVSFVPLTYDRLNSDLVYLRCVERSCIVAYNIGTKQLEVSCHPIGIVEDLSWRVVIPFVLPIWPAPVPRSPRRGTKRSRIMVTIE
ncbi:hypothetical protein NMG60_11028355 [Bertholletia excelsa]